LRACRSALDKAGNRMLVVISIIAVLISILLPALSSALLQARKIKDQANLKNLGNLSQTYASEDPQGIIGPVHPEALNFYYEGYAEYGGGPGTMNFVNWGEEFDPRTRPFNRLLYGPRGIVANTAPGDKGVFQMFQCPGNELGWQEWPGWGSDPRDGSPNTPYICSRRWGGPWPFPIPPRLTSRCRPWWAPRPPRPWYPSTVRCSSRSSRTGARFPGSR